ncbi:MAG TPA: AraC family transcriptional regulator [Blastocatellia bacterium]|nr:AraC family transcriptional regulator [Blastocatellia bacterium]
MSYGMSAGSFHGVALGHKATRDFILSEYSYPGGASVPVHHHSWPYFCFVLEGAFTEQSGGQNRTCGPGTLIYHPLGEEHSEHFALRPARVFNIEIAPSRLEQLGESASRLRSGLTINGGLLVGLAMRLHSAFAERGAASIPAIEDIALQLFGETWFPVSDDPEQIPAWLKEAREMIRFGFRTNLTVLEIAKAISIHPVHLSRTFRKVYGRKVSEAILHYRIEYACRMLASDNESLAFIAHDSGFADQSHFCREFKRIMGMTPGEYRNASRAMSFSPAPPRNE